MQGPSVYENWKAALHGSPSYGAYEHALFTDAEITSSVTAGFGPYQFLNAIPFAGSEGVRPWIVLRFEDHLGQEHELTPMEKTNDDLYHGGSLDDEVAALVSLSLGIRLKS